MSEQDMIARLLDQLTDVLADKIASRLPRPTKHAGTYTVKEAAQLIGCNVSTIRRQVEANLLPRVPNVKKLLIPVEAVEDWRKGRNPMKEAHG